MAIWYFKSTMYFNVVWIVYLGMRSDNCALLFSSSPRVFASVVAASELFITILLFRMAENEMWISKITTEWTVSVCQDSRVLLSWRNRNKIARIMILFAFTVRSIQATGPFLLITFILSFYCVYVSNSGCLSMPFECQWMVFGALVCCYSQNISDELETKIAPFLSKCQTNWMQTKNRTQKTFCLHRESVFFLNANKIDDPLTKYFVFDCSHTHCVHDGAQKYTGLSSTNPFVYTHAQKNENAEQKEQEENVSRLQSFAFACQKICVICQK